jgi:hypothetical protein
MLHQVLLELYDASQQTSRTIIQQIIRQLLPYILTDQARQQQIYERSVIKRLISLSQDELFAIGLSMPVPAESTPAPTSHISRARCRTLCDF